MPIDPRRYAMTPEGRTAERLADIERRSRYLERASLNVVAAGTGDWQPITLLNGFTSPANAVFPDTPGYYRDGLGRVFLRGYLEPPAGYFNTTPAMFNLPAGFRPGPNKGILLVAAAAGGATPPFALQIFHSLTTPGDVCIAGNWPNNVTGFWLTNASFRAEA